MLELKRKEKMLLSHFRCNARESLTSISRRTSIPVSTIFDKLRQYERQFIRRHTTLLDFAKLGYLTRANVMLKAGVDHRDALREFLMKHDHVNSLFKINNGYDFLVEVIFHHLKDMEDFLELLENKYHVIGKTVFYVIEDICRESFMADPEMVKLEAMPRAT